MWVFLSGVDFHVEQPTGSEGTERTTIERWRPVILVPCGVPLLPPLFRKLMEAAAKAGDVRGAEAWFSGRSDTASIWRGRTSVPFAILLDACAKANRDGAAYATRAVRRTRFDSVQRWMKLGDLRRSDLLKGSGHLPV